MLIVAKQNNVDNIFSIWNTVTGKFLGVNLNYDECIGKVAEYNGCSYLDAKIRADFPNTFFDIAEFINERDETEYEDYAEKELKNAVRLIARHYNTDRDFRNSFLSSIKSALKEIQEGTGLNDEAKAIADRIFGKE